MTLRDRLGDYATNKPAEPKPEAPPRPDAPGYVEWDGESGVLNSGVQPAGTTGSVDFDGILLEFGLDPDEVEIVGNPQLRMWDAAVGHGTTQRMRYWRIVIARRVDSAAFAMPDLTRLVRRVRPSRAKRKADEPRRGTVVALSDVQVGKVDARGGSQELVERVAQTLDLLDDQMRQERPHTALLADVGDIIEGFESAGGPLSQATSNDLSLMRQIELATVVVHSFVEVCLRHAQEVVVAGVGSNHCRWRAGKSNLGHTSDDWGLHILRTLRTQYDGRKAFEHVRFILPEEHTEHVVVDVLGTHVGVVHGHQARKAELIGEWWGKQVHGGSSLVNAEALLAGHFHNFQTYPSGRSPWSGREKRVHVAPTLDNGSSWYSNIAGADSDPGLLVLTIEEGVGVTAQRVLRPGRWQ